MPSRPKPSCIHVGCAARTDGGAYCDAHKRERFLHIDRQRGSSWSRGYDSRHREWRKLILSRDPVCVICKDALATVADHIQPLTAGGGWQLTNGQGLCQPCHTRKTVKDNRHGT